MKTTNNREQFIKEEILNKATLFNGNNMDALKSLPDNSIDSIVTDPPYGLSFMGKKWDHDVPSVEFWKEIFRVLKPGGHVLSFGGTRTYHRMVVNIEDAGFEIRDQIMWIYGSGFPKSHDLGKSTKKMGVETSQWDGWGTGLKPANEPICVARKPISEKNIAENVMKHGTGGLNIGESKIGNEVRTVPVHSNDLKDDKTLFGLHKTIQHERVETTEGRFPSNVIVDDSIGQSMGEQGKFFYTSKASKKERNLGLDEFADQKIEGRDKGQDGRSVPYKMGIAERKNIHPTVKPVDLMRYLIKLVTPKGGVVLDPFMGSGSTGIAAMIEGFNFVGMEMDPDYFQIAKKRIENFQLYKDLLDQNEKKKSKKASSKKEVNNTPSPVTTNQNLGIWTNRGLKRVS
jgi:site-specific DNA-methyltransferase (adenine-specific)